MTERERRFVTGGALLVALAVGATAAPRLLQDDGARDTERLEAERVARLRGLGASLDTLRVAARDAALVERRLAERYLQGATTPVAAAHLSGVIRDVAEATGVEILREGGLPAREVGRTTAVALQIVARSDLPGLLEFVAALDRAPILLSIEDLAVSGDPRELPGVAALTLTLQVTGYMLQPTPTGEGP